MQLLPSYCRIIGFLFIYKIFCYLIYSQRRFIPSPPPPHSAPLSPTIKDFAPIKFILHFTTTVFSYAIKAPLLEKGNFILPFFRFSAGMRAVQENTCWLNQAFMAILFKCIPPPPFTFVWPGIKIERSAQLFLWSNYIRPPESGQQTESLYSIHRRR